MIKKLDIIVLSHDLDEYGLKQGDIGAIVHVYKNEAAYEVEFVTAEGKTIAVLTLTEAEIRLFGNSEILHSRNVNQLVA